MGMAEDMRRLRAEMDAARAKRGQEAVERSRRLKQLREETEEVRATAREELAENGKLILELQQTRLLELGHRVQTLRKESRELVSGFRKELVARGKEDAIQRQEEMKKHGEAILELKREVSVLRSGFQEELREESIQAGARRQEAMQEVSADVERLRGEVGELLQGYREEFAEMRSSWAGEEGYAYAPASEPRAEVPKERVPPVTKAAEAPRKPVEAPEARRVVVKREPGARRGDPDDLERIVGVGPSTKQVLYEAGLFYFQDLARMSPEAVTNMLGSLARFANVEHWIEQAQQLVEEA